MADETQAEAPTAGHVIEAGVRLSESMIWDLQRAYYLREGIEAWKSGTVPSYITTNAFIAQAYARVLHAFLMDRFRATGGDASPVTIVELGAGHGRFGFLVLKKLMELSRLSPAPAAPFRYVMTDLVQKNLDFWRRQEQLRPLVERKLLDFARYDIERDASLTLQVSGETLSPERPAGALVVLANYVFDSLAVDVFRVVDGALEESRVTVKSTQAFEPDLADPEVIGRLEVTYDHSRAAGEVYPEAAFNDILSAYARKLGDTTFLLPVGALRGVARLEAMCAGQLFLLSADKGYNHAHQLLSQPAPSLVRHGSFSFNVNYHAIGQYFREKGGFSLHTSERSGSIEVSAFMLQGKPEESAQTCMAFQRDIEEFGPVDFFLLQRDIAKLEGTPTLEQCLALLRLSGWDPEVFYDVRVPLREQVEAAHPEVQAEVSGAMARVWELFYSLGNDRDVPFAMGRIAHRMSQYHSAIHYYQHSLRMFGEDRATLYNIGLCLYKAGQSAAALHYFDKALAMDPTYSYARDWKLRVQAEMRRGAVAWDVDPLG